MPQNLISKFKKEFKGDNKIRTLINLLEEYSNSQDEELKAILEARIEQEKSSLKILLMDRIGNWLCSFIDLLSLLNIKGF